MSDPAQPALGVDPAELAEVEEWAGEVRAQWQAVIDLVGCGRLHFADAIHRVPIDPVLAEMKVLKLLEARPGAKKVLTRRRFDELGFAPDTKLRELGNDGRALVIEAFGEPSQRPIQ